MIIYSGLHDRLWTEESREFTPVFDMLLKFLRMDDSALRRELSTLLEISEMSKDNFFSEMLKNSRRDVENQPRKTY
jgi:hypothetical protein